MAIVPSRDILSWTNPPLSTHSQKDFHFGCITGGQPRWTNPARQCRGRSQQRMCGVFTRASPRETFVLCKSSALILSFWEVWGRCACVVLAFLCPHKQVEFKRVSRGLQDGAGLCRVAEDRISGPVGQNEGPTDSLHLFCACLHVYLHDPVCVWGGGTQQMSTDHYCQKHFEHLNCSHFSISYVSFRSR